MNSAERANTLLDKLRRLQEPQGYYFNDNAGLVLELLEGLLINKDRYGYMCCPCRLAGGSRAADRDITCPCVYRTADVQAYGSCYCGLYVSAEWLAGAIERQYVPERRPPSWPED